MATRRTAAARQAINFACAKLLNPKIKIFFMDWDKEHLQPCYIPSGKPARTHMIDCKLLPDWTAEDAPYSLTRQLIAVVEPKLLDDALGQMLTTDPPTMWFQPHEILAVTPDRLAEACLRASGKWTPEMEEREADGTN